MENVAVQLPNIEDKNVKKDCNFLNKCNSPLCALDSESLEKGIWYSDEEVCRNREFLKKQFIKTQKKIAKFRPVGYFTYQMLNNFIIVSKGIKGINPDPPHIKDIEGWYREQEKKWINKRSRTKRILSDEQKKILRARLALTLSKSNRLIAQHSENRANL